MDEPKRQLVIQFPESAFADFDEVVKYEDALIEILGDNHEVDGHDIGSGEVNFFVFTPDPKVALDLIHDGRGGDLLSHPHVRAAARPLDHEHYEPLWPLGDDRNFTIR